MKSKIIYLFLPLKTTKKVNIKKEFFQKKGETG